MDINIIINKVLIPFGLAVFVYVLVPYIYKITTKEQREEIYFWIKLGVRASDQVLAHKTGKERKEYVLDFLSSKGIEITDEVLVMIESEVKNLRLLENGVD